MTSSCRLSLAHGYLPVWLTLSIGLYTIMWENRNANVESIELSLGQCCKLSPNWYKFKNDIGNYKPTNFTLLVQRNNLALCQLFPNVLQYFHMMLSSPQQIHVCAFDPPSASATLLCGVWVYSGGPMTVMAQSYHFRRQIWSEGVDQFA